MFMLLPAAARVRHDGRRGQGMSDESRPDRVDLRSQVPDGVLAAGERAASPDLAGRVRPGPASSSWRTRSRRRRRPASRTPSRRRVGSREPNRLGCRHRANRCAAARSGIFECASATEDGWSDWSPVLRVEAGLLDARDWVAPAITLPDDPGAHGPRPSPVLRRDVPARRPMSSRRRLYVTSLGLHHVSDQRAAGLRGSPRARLDQLPPPAPRRDLRRHLAALEGRQRHRRHPRRWLVSGAASAGGPDSRCPVRARGRPHRPARGRAGGRDDPGDRDRRHLAGRDGRDPSPPTSTTVRSSTSGKPGTAGSCRGTTRAAGSRPGSCRSIRRSSSRGPRHRSGRVAVLAVEPDATAGRLCFASTGARTSPGGFG